MTMPPLLLNDLADNENFVFLETIKTDKDNFKSFLFLEPVNVLETSRIDEVETVLKVVQAQMRILEYADKMDSLEGKKEADRGTKTISDLFRKERDKNA